MSILSTQIYLTRSEVAAVLGITPSGVDQAVKRGTIPPPIRLSTRLVRFLAEDYTPAGLATWATVPPHTASVQRGRQNKPNANSVGVTPARSGGKSG